MNRSGNSLVEFLLVFPLFISLTFMVLGLGLRVIKQFQLETATELYAAQPQLPMADEWFARWGLKDVNVQMASKTFLARASKNPQRQKKDIQLFNVLAVQTSPKSYLPDLRAHVAEVKVSPHEK